MTCTFTNGLQHELEHIIPGSLQPGSSDDAFALASAERAFCRLDITGELSPSGTTMNGLLRAAFSHGCAVWTLGRVKPEDCAIWGKDSDSKARAAQWSHLVHAVACQLLGPSHEKRRLVGAAPLSARSCVSRCAKHSQHSRTPKCSMPTHHRAWAAQSRSSAWPTS